MVDALYTQSATRLRAPFVVDKYGNPATVRDWANAESLALSGVSIQPDSAVGASSSETVGDRSTVITNWNLRTARGVDADILPGDRVVMDEITTEVQGEVGRFILAGAVHHIECSLRRVDG